VGAQTSGEPELRAHGNHRSNAVKHAPVFIGTSGWYYDHWEGVLYPPGLPKAKRFLVYAGDFNSVEINATYYRLPSESMAGGWYAKAPEGFIYAVKANRDITHNRRLSNAEDSLNRFLNAVKPLKDKLGAILFQLPPSMKRDDTLLSDFLSLLPGPPRSCFEFRHASWECDETYAALDQYGAGHVVVSKKGYPFAEKHTAGFAYYRLHGPEQMCASPYSEAWLESHGRRLDSLSKSGTTSFTFFNNDIGGHAVHNARSLKAFLQKM
jgi:uncharacterized protein YecE (DUF72 family)